MKAKKGYKTQKPRDWLAGGSNGILKKELVEGVKRRYTKRTLMAKG